MAPNIASSSSAFDQYTLLDRLTEAAQSTSMGNAMVINELAKPVAGLSKHADETDIMDGDLIQWATKPFRCLGVLDCALNIYFDYMVKILEIFRHTLPHLSYKTSQESRESVGNLPRYNYFLP